MTEKFKPYANEADVLRIGELEIENRVDRVTLTGDVELTRDKAGLALARSCCRSLMVWSKRWRPTSNCPKWWNSRQPGR